MRASGLLLLAWLMMVSVAAVLAPEAIDDNGTVVFPFQTSRNSAHRNGVAPKILGIDVHATDWLADFLVLSADFLTVPEEQIRDILPLATYVGGRQVFAGAGATF